jgi:hypothetical protein
VEHHGRIREFARVRRWIEEIAPDEIVEIATTVKAANALERQLASQHAASDVSGGTRDE